MNESLGEQVHEIILAKTQNNAHCSVVETTAKCLEIKELPIG